MATKEFSPVRGFFRIKIGEGKDGRKIVGDSGWCENEVVNLGFQDFICGCVAGAGGSKQLTAMLLGTGSAPGAAHTALDGSTISGTCTMSVETSKTVQATRAWASTDNPGVCNISNIALGNTAATICCGNTFASSTWNANQGVSATYQLVFATA